MKKCFVLLVFALFLHANELKINANITALQYKQGQNALLIGTDAGEVLWYDVAQKKMNAHFLIKLPSVQNYYEKGLGARIHSLDELNSRFLLVSEGDFGTQNISVCKSTIKKGLDAQDACETIKSPFANIKKAFFIDENTALLVLLSSDIKLVDLKHQMPVLKEFKFSLTSLNDAVLDEQRQNLLVASESGELQVFDIKAWKHLANYDQIHKDTLDQVDFKNAVIVSCGKEKKVGIVRGGEQKFLQKDSLIYSCALSPSGQIAAFATNTAGKESTELINTSDLKQIKRFDEDFFAKFIIFLNENDFLIAGGQTILFRSVQ